MPVTSWWIRRGRRRMNVFLQGCVVSCVIRSACCSFDRPAPDLELAPVGEQRRSSLPQRRELRMLVEEIENFPSRGSSP
jgi:hypothetical protein